MTETLTLPFATARPRGALAFFALVYGSTWLFQLPFLLAQRGLLSGPAERFLPLVVLGFFGPFLVAIALALKEGGREGLRALFRPLRIWRVGLGWYLLAVSLPSAVFWVSRALAVPLSASDLGPWFYPPSRPEQLAAMAVIPFTEQIPWLGFAFPRLRARYGSLAALTIVGLAWALFHVQKHSLLGPEFASGPPAIMIASMTAGAIVFGWIQLRARGSLLLAVLAHAAVYLNNPFGASPPRVTPMLIQTVGLAVAALCVALGDRKVWRRSPPRPDHASQLPPR